MADEPRRSVRATKGQHTKSLDVLDAEPAPKKKGGNRGKKVAEEPEEEIIRCICGVTESSEDDPEAWIACDSCNAWQHNVCMGVSTFSEDVPKSYFCEQCRPNLPFHKELLEGIKRGEKVWEERRARFEKQQREELEAEQEGPKKGRKKGKRTSDPKTDLGTNGKAKSSTPIPAEKKKEKTASVKRNRDELNDNVSKEPNKVRKVSAAHTTPRQDSPQTGQSVKIIDLDTVRQGGAKLVQKGLLHSIPVAIKSGIYALGKGDTVEAKAERLAIQVEQAVHNTHPDKTAYSKQARALSSNLKQNQELTNGLLARTLSVDALAVMSTDDMASKELKKETAEMKARADKQSIMITDDGPRIRRTHKGDEIIEGDNFTVANDSTISSSRRRSMLDPNADMATRSRENSPGEQVELPESIDDYRSRDDIRSNAIPKQPLNVDTKQSPHARKQSTASNFDINKVFQSVQSPTDPQHISRRVSTQNAPPANGPGVDPEIDKLLQDDGNDSPPYSPAEYDSDPEIIWHGVVNMDPVAKFPAVAKHVAGADMSRTMPWSEILTKELKVAGRIQSDRANEYLCSLRYSPQTDLVVVNLTPTGESALQEFTNLYEYFQTKDRYGVLANRAVGNIRDTYLVPIPPNPGHVPDFIANLEGHKIPEVRSEPMIIVALVIRHELPQTSQGFEGAASPSLPTHPHHRQMSISGAGPQMSPIGPPQGPFPGAQPTNHYNMQSQASQSQQDIDQRRGEENANRILGEYATAPTVGFLMPQAWQMREVEWDIIRKILEEDAKARTDLAWLNYMLEKRLAGN